MVGSRQAGFTIVEISLFMAITGMLFLIAVLGTGNTIRTVRFTDSGRSLEAFAQKQYDDLINGLNNRDNQVSCNNGTIDTTTGSALGTSNCLLIGKLVVFTQSSPDVKVYNVVGTEPGSVNYAQSDDALISAFAPKTITTTAVASYTVPWGAPLVGFKRLSDSTATNGLLLIRSPKSTRIVSYTFKVTAIVPADLSAIVNTAANRSQTTNFCIKNADTLGPPAKLVISGGASQSAASVVFDSNDGECNGI
jgi:type II secretory pathway pseudopilin PulG